MDTSDNTSEFVEIPLTRGYIALVDKCDSDLAQLKWYLGDTGYAMRRDGKPKKTTRMHRLIAERMGILIPEIGIDHINGNRLDNRRSNLRVASQQLNTSNSHKSKLNTSGYKGVRFEDTSWRVTLKSDGTKYDFGRYASPEFAARIYDCATIKLNGLIVAGLNFPGEPYSNDILEIVEYVLNGKRLPPLKGKSSSLFRGVHYHISNRNDKTQSYGWIAIFNKKYLGYFQSEIEAAKAWDEYAKSQDVPRLYLNFRGEYHE